MILWRVSSSRLSLEERPLNASCWGEDDGGNQAVRSGWLRPAAGDKIPFTRVNELSDVREVCFAGHDQILSKFQNSNRHQFLCRLPSLSPFLLF